MPYGLSAGTTSPMDTHDLDEVPAVQSRMWSTIALAADMADDSLRASTMAAPRFCTVVIKSPCSQASSPMTAGAALPPMVACAASGNWVDEWFPHTATLRTSDGATPAFRASWLVARLWSRRVRHDQADEGRASPAAAAAIAALVLAGLPTTSTFTVFLAWAARALPCAAKIATFRSSKSLRSMPGLRGNAPSIMHTSTPAKASSTLSVYETRLRIGLAMSSSSRATPRMASSAGVMSKRTSSTGVSLPNMSPRAIRGSSA
mmetsp:Transcript_5883/g.19208  ORF Transcript_5883/g.19208 Transcript_5883/m.19208 type:complete len:261 (-) Transcript_5883:78-860(-)